MTMHDDDALVTVATFNSVWEASMARGVLEAAGIRALVPEEALVRSKNMMFPTGSLRVLESDKDRAIAELRRRQIQLVQPPERDE